MQRDLGPLLPLEELSKKYGYLLGFISTKFKRSKFSLNINIHPPRFTLPMFLLFVLILFKQTKHGFVAILYKTFNK